MDYYSATKRKKLVVHVTTWMGLESIMLSEKVHLKGHVLYDSAHLTFSKGQNYKMANRLVVWGARWLGREAWL